MKRKLKQKNTVEQSRVCKGSQVGWAFGVYGGKDCGK